MITGEIKAEIVAGVDQASFNTAGSKIKSFARDTGKQLDSAKKITLEANVANATLKLQSIRKQLKLVGDDVAKKKELIISTNTAQSNLTEAKRKLQNFRNTGDETTSRLQKKFDGLGGSVKEMGVQLAGAFAFSKIVDFGKSVFNLAATYQKYEAVLTNTFGSQAEAVESMELVKDIAAQTPFEINNLTESYIKLVNRGFKPTRDEIISLGDLASSQGKDFDQLTEAILDAQTGEFERLKEFGVKAKVAGDKVTFTFKGQAIQVANTEEAIKNYVLSLGQAEGVAGSMAAISQTLGGRFSNILDKLTQIGTEIGLRLVPFFEALTEGFLSLISNETGLYGIATAVTAIGVAMAFTTGGLTALVGGIVALTVAGGGLTAWFSETQNTIPGLTENLNNAQTAIDELNDKFAQGGIGMDAYVQQLITLEDELANAQAEYDALNDKINENKDIISDNDDEIAALTDGLVRLKKRQADATAGIKEGGIMAFIYKQKLERATSTTANFESRLASLKAESLKAKQTNEFLSGSFGGVSGAINKISTAKTREEFDALRQNAIQLLKVFATIGIQQFNDAKDSGDTAALEIAKKRLATLRTSLQVVKDIKFVEAKPVANDTTTTSSTTPTTPTGGSSGSSATKDLETELKKQKELEYKAEEEKFDLLRASQKKIKDLKDEQAKEIATARKKLATEDQKILDSFAKTIETSYDDAQKEIEATEKTIDKLNEKIADTQSKIIELELDAGEDIATRAVEIEAELNTEDLDTEKRIELEKELALALANTTEEERVRAELLAGESETEKILRETAEKKQELENQIADLEIQKATEQQILQDSLDNKLLAEQQYTAAFGLEIKKRTDMQIAEQVRLAQALARSKSSSSTTTNTTTNNGPTSVTVNAQTNASPEMIGQAVSNVIISAEKGNSL